MACCPASTAGARNRPNWPPFTKNDEPSLRSSNEAAAAVKLNRRGERFVWGEFVRHAVGVCLLFKAGSAAAVSAQPQVNVLAGVYVLAPPERQRASLEHHVVVILRNALGALLADEIDQGCVRSRNTDSI